MTNTNNKQNSTGASKLHQVGSSEVRVGKPEPLSTILERNSNMYGDLRATINNINKEIENGLLNMAKIHGLSYKFDNPNDSRIDKNLSDINKRSEPELSELQYKDYREDCKNSYCDMDNLYIFDRYLFEIEEAAIWDNDYIEAHRAAYRLSEYFKSATFVRSHYSKNSLKVISKALSWILKMTYSMVIDKTVAQEFGYIRHMIGNLLGEIDDCKRRKSVTRR